MSPKQPQPTAVSPSPKSPAGRFFAVIGKTLRILAKLLGVLLVLLILTFLVFHFIVWPKHDRERFAEAEQIVEERIVSLGVRAEDMQRVHECRRTGEKYGPGSPYCYFEHSFNVSDTQTKEDVFGAFGDEFELSFYQPRASAEGPVAGWFKMTEQLVCGIDTPEYRIKNGPPDMFTVHCTSSVARYIYN